MMKDTLQRFLFENIAVRGELVHLDATWQAVLERHEYPMPVQKVLGELMAAVSLLIATLKFKGQLIAQIQGDGPVNLLVVEGTTDKTLRAMANCKSETFVDESLHGIFGDARLVITLEPDKGERYQGIVALTGENLAAALTDYLLRSEQLDTDLWLVADDKQTAGLLIQKLPDTEKVKSSSNILDFDSAEENIDLDGWNRIQQLSSTIKDEELLELSAEEIIHRLYHEEDVRLFEAEHVSFRCSCSRERVTKMLHSLGIKEVQSMIEELSKIEVACEFCNHNYSFDAVDAEQIFASDISYEPPKTEQ
ncbi:MAG: Hsp33 family molecular chaperone HslO [Gammaproteobacteria bacterium]|nr:Hsp33 family molecular chaperone HslO [Gammaproteobacteria bacterium]MDH5660507.1 Hsp33 family molecular chaperone HslO [Gammaproteobacteria bacterium]